MNNILEVQEDSETGELYLRFTPDMLSQMGWHEGDMLEWIDKGDGSYVIQKKEPIYNPSTKCAKCGMIFEGATGYWCPEPTCPTFTKTTL